MPIFFSFSSASGDLKTVFGVPGGKIIPTTGTGQNGNNYTNCAVKPAVYSTTDTCTGSCPVNTAPPIQNQCISQSSDGSCIVCRCGVSCSNGCATTNANGVCTKCN